MAKRKGNSAGAVRILAVAGRYGAVLVAGVLGGYLWRSYAPLPFPDQPALSGVAPATPKEDAIARAAAQQREAEEEVSRLKRELDKLGEKREEKQAQIDEIQIQDLLKNK